MKINLLGAAESSPGRRHHFTMLHGHYIAMGGLAIDPSNAPKIFMSNFGKTRTLTFKSLDQLLEYRPDLMPDFSKGALLDKSKADGFAKMLVCFQAAWFCTQAIVRIATGLTISTLELNTFAHALCTLLIYFLWWDKPLNIGEPTLIPVAMALPGIALLSVLDSAGFDATGYRTHTLRQGCAPSPIEDTGCEAPYTAHIDIWPSYQDDYLHSAGIHSKLETAENLPRHIKPYVWVKHGERIHGFDIETEFSKVSILPFLPPKRVRKREQEVYLPLGLIHCLALARSVFQDEKQKGLRDVHLIDRVRNIPLAPDSGTWKPTIGIAVAALIYGGLHMTAWGAPMSATRRLWWRIASLAVSFSGLAYIPYGVLTDRDPGRPWPWGETWTDIARGICMIVPTLAYSVARIFLVVECFINIRHLPASTFEVTRWSRYFPHIS
jgi:hypothetical protein